MLCKVSKLFPFMQKTTHQEEIFLTIRFIFNFFYNHYYSSLLVFFAYFYTFAIKTNRITKKAPTNYERTTNIIFFNPILCDASSCAVAERESTIW